MIAESITLTPKEAEKVIETLANGYGLSKQAYINAVASKSYVLTKEGKNGTKIAVFSNKLPQVFSSVALAENELTNEDTDEYKYTGFEVQNEAAFWEKVTLGEYKVA